jgi:hypothetical protein
MATKVVIEDSFLSKKEQHKATLVVFLSGDKKAYQVIRPMIEGRHGAPLQGWKALAEDIAGNKYCGHQIIN